MSTLITNQVQTTSGKVILRSAGSIINVTQLYSASEVAVSNSANGVLWSTSFTKLYNGATTDLFVHAQLNGRTGNSGQCGPYLEIAGTRDYGFVYEYSPWGNQEQPIWGMGRWTGVGAGSVSVIAGWSPNNGSAGEAPFTYWNATGGRNDSRARPSNSKIIIYEVVI